MRIADLTLAVRPRSPYEAMDLGVRLAQTEWALLTRAWLAVAGPVFLLALLLTLTLDNMLWGWLLLWWCKPLYDMALLLVLSRRVFGSTLSVRELWRLLRDSAGMGLIGHLLWRRFSFSRAYALPVWVLEQLPDNERRARLALLQRQHNGKAQWLHIVMAHFDSFIQLTLISIVFWLLPDSLRSGLWEMFSSGGSELTYLLSLGASFVAMLIIEPFYVAAGFALYLNRRTELEAWDLELAFRHLAGRMAERGKAA
ncbi:MAG: hypothetical protein Q8J78_11765 [Moraxellaceae bacterium]|nr:hypothetical protein [Moraxellaceae bacterium]